MLSAFLLSLLYHQFIISHFVPTLILYSFFNQQGPLKKDRLAAEAKTTAAV